ncbi:MAG: copper amine oxidase N-terminal domain-containing protein, partial [Clostridia bacterium]|nr:copper amine oxidase N-terminal domain-containing protein [Clostridia bacterium]
MTGASAAGAVTVTDSYGKEYEIGSDALTVKFNGKAVQFPDAQPFVDENNRTMIPLRAVTETMGAEVSWDQVSQTAKIEQNGITIMVPIGSDTISVTQNGRTST